MKTNTDTRVPRRSWLAIAGVLVGLTGSVGAEQPTQAEAEITAATLSAQVHFAPARSKLRPETRDALRQLAEVMLQSPALRVRIDGHCDGQASDFYNLPLAFKRALNVKRFLQRHGVAPDRLVIAAYSEDRPLASNETREGRAQNRRVALALEVATPDPDAQLASAERETDAEREREAGGTH